MAIREAEPRLDDPSLHQCIGEEDDRLLWVASSNGFVKRSQLADYPRKGRATGGVATMQLVPRTGLVGAAVVSTGEDCLLVSQTGRTGRVTPDGLPVVARDRRGTPGLKLEGSDVLARLVVLPN